MSNANYPSSLDTNTNLPNPGDQTYTDGTYQGGSNPALNHATQHDVVNDAVKALEVKVGIGAAAPSGGQVLVGVSSGSSEWRNLVAGDISGLAPVATSGSYADLTNKPDLAALDNLDTYPSLANFPATGVSDRLYLANDTGLLYRWNGTGYSQTSAIVSDATTAAKGIIQLAADLGGTATSPLTKARTVTVTVAKTVGQVADYHCANYDSDWKAFQAAIDYLTAQGGGTLFARAGNYTIARRIWILASNIIVRGEGTGTLFTAANNMDQEIWLVGNGRADDASINENGVIVNCNDVSFYDFKMDGNKANQYAGNYADVRYGPSATRNLLRYRSDAQNSYGGVVDGVHAINGKQNGISSESHAFVTIRNCIAENCDNHGIWFENGSQMTIEDNWTRNNVLAGIKGLSAGGKVIGNESKGDKGAGFSMQSFSGTFTGNIAFRAGWQGAITTASPGMYFSACNNLPITGNYIYGAYGHGLILNGCDFCSVTGNTFRRNGQYANDTYSDIYLTYEGGGTTCNTNTFNNNTFRNDIDSDAGHPTGQFYTNRAKYNFGVYQSATGHSGNYFAGNMPSTATAEQPTTDFVDSGLRASNNVWAEGQLGVNPVANFNYGYFPSSVAGWNPTTSTQTIDFKYGNYLVGTGYNSTVNVAIAPGSYIGQRGIFRYNQDTGNKQLTWDATTCRWSGGVAPVFSGVANSYDLIYCVWDGSFWYLTSPAQANGQFLKLTGGTLTGTLNITPASGYSSLNLIGTNGKLYFLGGGAGDNQNYIQSANAAGSANLPLNITGVNNTVGSTLNLKFSNVKLSGKITNLSDGTAASDGVNKGQMDAADALKAPLASPALTGTPTAPTASTGTSTTQIATTAFVASAITAAASAYDDVKEYANMAAFPATGVADTIYLADDTGYLYRWSGSTYVQVGGGSVNDATTGAKGIVQLAGDLGGTAASPTTPTAVHKTGNETAAGDKTWTGNQNISKSVPEQRLTAADSNYARQTRADTGNVFDLYNQTLRAAGKAVTIAGNNDFVQLTWSSIGTSVSFDLWFTLGSGTRTNGVLLSYGSGRIIADLTKIGWQPNIFGSTVNTTATVAANTPHHLVITQTGTTYNMWLDGTQIVTAGTAPGAYNDSNNGQSKLGSYSGSDGITGSLDEVCIYSKVLSGTEVATSYNAGAGLYHTSAANLTHIYHLDEGSGTQTINVGLRGGYGTFSSSPVPGWGTTLITDPAAMVETTLLESANGGEGHEGGISYFGDNAARTAVRGKSVRFYTADGVERFRMDENGNFGFGTTQPTAPFTASAAAFTTAVGTNRQAIMVTQNDTTNNPVALDVLNNGTGVTLNLRSGTGQLFDIRQTASTLGSVGYIADASGSTAGDGRVLDMVVNRPGGQGMRISSGNTSVGADLLFINQTGGGKAIRVQGGGSDTFSVAKDGTTIMTGMSAAIVTKTANYTATAADYTILVDATAGNITITLPSAIGLSGKLFNVKKIDNSANTVTIAAPNPGTQQTIDGANTRVINAQYAGVSLQGNNVNWFVL